MTTRTVTPSVAFLCGACKHGSYSHLLTGKDLLHGLQGQWDLVTCDNCQLTQMHPMPRPEELTGYYPATYYAHQDSHGTFRKIRVSRIKKFVLRHHYGYPPGKGRWPLRLAARCLSLLISKKKLFQWIGEGRLLDVGCGQGKALWRLQAFGWSVQGVETDSQAAAMGHEHGLRIHVGDLGSARLSDQSLDLVRMSHVLEHTPDPVAVLAEVRRILQPGGRAWIAVPNLGSAGFKRYQHNWFPLEIPRHLYHFTESSLRQLCQQVGLRVLSVRFKNNVSTTMDSMEYERRERAERSMQKLTGKPMPRRKWIRRLMWLKVWWQDRRRSGDTMEFTCGVANNPSN